MLAHDHEHDTLEQALSALTCHIDVPPKWFADADKRGPLPTAPREQRRFARFHYATRAILYVQQSLPALARSKAKSIVYTKDLSREGVAFLHVEQLFPGECMPIWLPGGARKEIMAVRCLKLNDRCYQIGACFI